MVSECCYQSEISFQGSCSLKCKSVIMEVLKHKLLQWFEENSIEMWAWKMDVSLIGDSWSC